MAESEATVTDKRSAEEAAIEQSRSIAGGMNHWLDLFDKQLGEDGVPPAQRPLRALQMLIHEGALEVRTKDSQISLKNALSDLVDEVWFRVLYDAVEYWYAERFGRALMQKQRTSTLIGAVLIHGSPFTIQVPANRSKVEDVGESAWMFFDDDVVEEEDPTEWICGGPNLSTLSKPEQDVLDREAAYVAGVLRSVEFRRVTFRSDCNEEAQKLLQSTVTYLGQAAERLVSWQPPTLGPAWFDLQMASETALKAVLLSKTGQQPKIHPLKELLSKARCHGVAFEANRLDQWPAFGTISDWRYGQGDPPGTLALHAAYIQTLDLVKACMAPIVPGIKPGFGLLLRYKPWSTKDATGRLRD